MTRPKQPKILTAQTELHGKGVVLRPLRKSDGDALYRYIRDPEIGRWTLALHHPYRRKDTDEYLKLVAKNTRSGLWRYFAIRRLDSDEPIGMVGVHRSSARSPDADMVSGSRDRIGVRAL